MKNMYIIRQKISRMICSGLFMGLATGAVASGNRRGPKRRPGGKTRVPVGWWLGVR